jgi:hypothetical protein
VTVSMNPMVSVILFRKETIRWAESFARNLICDSKSEDRGSSPDIAHFLELLQEGKRQGCHSGSWLLHGARRAQSEAEIVELAGEGYSYLERSRVIRRLAGAYSWSFIPWGMDFTSQMLTVVTNGDADIATRFATSLETDGCTDLLLSTYSMQDLDDHRFRGAVFSRRDSSRARDIWSDGMGYMDSALVFKTAPSPSSDEERVLQTQVEVFGTSVQLGWVLARNEAEFLRHAVDPFTMIVTAPNLDKSDLSHAMQHFESIKRDPLRFGVRALRSAAWIYVPGTERSKSEIYVNNDATVTTKVFQNKRLLSSSFFAHRYFC